MTYRSPNIEWITDERVQIEEQARRPRKRIPQRPDFGPVCGCGRILYEYEYKLHKCLRCAHTSIIQAREGIPEGVKNECVG